MRPSVSACAHVVVYCTCWWLLVVLCASSRQPWASAAATTLTSDEAQAWRSLSPDYNWQLFDTSARVQIVGRGVQDASGHLYFAGTVTHATDAGRYDQNIFVARINADDTLAWTQEVRALM